MIFLAKKTLSIDEGVLVKAKAVAGKTGFRDAEELIEYLINESAKAAEEKAPRKGAHSNKASEIVKKRLEHLGYL